MAAFKSWSSTIVTSSQTNHAPRTRETILSAAIRLFQQFGFSGLGMRQIADNLGIKAPSLYHHFASKEDLAQYAMQQYRAEQAARLQAIAAAVNLTVAEQLLEYAELFAQMLGDGRRPCLYLMMVKEPSFQENACLEELRLFVAQNVDWLERISRGERELAELIFASFEGMMAVSLVEKDPQIAFRKRANNFLKIVSVQEKTG
ncbi:TetR/AcrR family transcriptional regulator [Duganella sp. CF458]|uniref:TetR/AcrR family transcriptional regulator n=1 Tax=Duganella sp. CF458 TaxID=1884368 RepID=UPI000B811E8E